MPEEVMLKKNFKDCFIINSPKESVGGNGYWYQKIGDFSYIIVFDCEGSGHLASIMVRIYSQTINKLIINHNITFPTSILQLANKEILSKFENKKEIVVNNSADLGIIKFNHIKNSLEFAGANINLLVEANGEINLFEGDKMKIASENKKGMDFGSITLQTDSGSRLYFSTKGLFEQIGGSDFKKIGVQRIMKLITDNKQHTIGNQKKILEHFVDNWMKLHPQSDDMLIIGIEI